MILSNEPHASILATVLRVCVVRGTGPPASMRNTNNFAPTTKDCAALERRTSKFEFILLRPTMKIHTWCAGRQQSLAEYY